MKIETLLETAASLKSIEDKIRYLLHVYSTEGLEGLAWLELNRTVSSIYKIANINHDKTGVINKFLSIFTPKLMNQIIDYTKTFD